MTMLAKARQNRLSAINTRLDRMDAPTAVAQPAFRSRRTA